ncbi:putative importin beta-2 subunit [Naematelia encephala]|uniref:Putative importin beta-2 subunit n=1 Tax=Naematelia encephala TaxID=71784 RepID=A0A1Y2BJM6_9TREE|nr:putative importin beta-2 subunit [Naematelia encephala]
MSWQPQSQGLEQVLDMLRLSVRMDAESQQSVSKRLEQLRQVPDFYAYLAYALVFCTNEDASHRSVAGILLKNMLSSRSGPPTDANDAQALAFVKASILQVLQDQDPNLRRTACQVVSALLANEQPGGWTEALEALMKGMGAQDINVVEGCFQCFLDIAEDSPAKLDFAVQGRNLLDHLVPEFIKFTSYDNPKIRLLSLKILHALGYIRIPAVDANIDDYLKALFSRASDTSPDVRRAVCTALGLILNTRPDKLVPELSNVVDYMAYCTKDKDEQVALEACEFWLTFAEDANLQGNLKPYLPKIVPLLLAGMVYSEMDLATLDVDEDDEAVPDRDTDIKPKAYSSKTHAHESNDQASSAAGQARSREAAEKALEEDDEDDYDDDDDFDDDDDTGGWNIRKCSAAALDVMAVSFKDDLLQILLPVLKDKLFSDDWTQRESGILALGAVAEGCIDGLTPHLPQLVPWLIGMLKDSKALVRSITCWTLGRYASWCVQASPEDKTKFFLPTMEGLLQMVLDHNKRVQEAGCSAFATLEEEAGSELVPFLEPILRNLTFAFNKYQQKNLLILYDALGTLADSVGSALGQPLYLDILMPPLIDRWQKLLDNDPDLVPLLECLSSVSIAAGMAFAPYTAPVYERCINIIQSSLTEYNLFSSNVEVDEPDRTFIVVSLDLLSGLTQGLGEQIGQLISNTQPSLLQLMALCLTHYEPPIRQSAHALLGDLAMSCFALLRPVVPQLMPPVMEQIVAEPAPDCVSVCNNAAWAAGEIALQYNGDAAPLEPFVPALVERLVPILLNPKSPKSLSENAAVTIGRLGLTCPALVAPNLSTFAQAWCKALWEIKDNDEKDSAFRGFCMMISVNPGGLDNSFIWFCNAVVKWQHPSSQLDQMFRQILQGFKNSLGSAWEQSISTFPPVIRQRLAERYNV